MDVTPGSATDPLRLSDPPNRASSRAVTYWRVSAVVSWVVVLAVACTVWLVWLRDHRWVPPVLAVLCVCAVVEVSVMPGVRYQVHRWQVTATAVRTRTGWLAREQRIAPLSRVQTVDSTQGIVMRAFGLTSVTVTTASSAGPVVIEALDRDTAERLVAELTAVTAATPGDAT